MKKVSAKQRKVITTTVEGQFPLNSNNSDRISFKADFNQNKEATTINNVSYEMLYEQRWEWIIRYDDHGGSSDFHFHERYSFDDESSFQILSAKPQGSKKKSFEWAISDIRKNYLGYRLRFCERNRIDLY